jgi:hypothetical protein
VCGRGRPSREDRVEGSALLVRETGWEVDGDIHQEVSALGREVVLGHALSSDSDHLGWLRDRCALDEYFVPIHVPQYAPETHKRFDERNADRHAQVVAVSGEERMAHGLHVEDEVPRSELASAGVAFVFENDTVAVGHTALDFNVDPLAPSHHFASLAMVAATPHRTARALATIAGDTHLLDEAGPDLSAHELRML